MIVYRISEQTGRTRKRELPITEQQYYDFMCGYIDTLPIDQEQMLFLMTGIVPEEIE